MSNAGSPAPFAPELPRIPWIFRASPTQLRLLALAVAVFVFVTSMAVDFLLFEEGASPVPSFAVSDCLAALIAALFTLKLVAHANERRLAVRQRLRTVAEMNHHIRNALHTIQLSAHTTRDAEAIVVIGSSVNRIEWALEEILGNGEPKSSQTAGDKPS